MESPPVCGGDSSPPSAAASPEFEFWMVGKNPSFPPPSLLTADELFSDGVVLPLHTLQISPPDTDADGGFPAAALPEHGPAPAPDLPAVTFKWKDVFKAAAELKERRKQERRVSGGGGGNAELININIWPFSRSRSAGHAAGGNAGPWGKPRASASAAAPAGRNASSAPCSRSNSRGESSGPAIAPTPALPAASSSIMRRWVPGQSRAAAGSGIRLGRPSPVWQLRRNKLQQAAAEQKDKANAGGKKRSASADAAAAAAGDGEASKVVSVDACISYRSKGGCGGDGGGGGEEGNPPPGLFGLRTFFSKKVY